MQREYISDRLCQRLQMLQTRYVKSYIKNDDGSRARVCAAVAAEMGTYDYLTQEARSVYPNRPIASLCGQIRYPSLNLGHRSQLYIKLFLFTVRKRVVSQTALICLQT